MHREDYEISLPAEPNEKKENPMKWVDLVEFDAIAKKAEVAIRATLDGGHIRFEGDPQMVKQLEEKGVYSPELRRLVKPADGEAFLAALGYEFRTPYFFATDVQEGDKPEPPGAFKMPPMSEPPAGRPSHPPSKSSR